MIELDIKIRAKDSDTVKLFTDLMITGLSVANQMKQTDITISAEKDGDTITLIRKEIIKRDPSKKYDSSVKFTPIEDFITNSDLSVRSCNILGGITFQGTQHIVGKVPFEFAEDITEERFMKCLNAGKRSWEEVEAELKRQKIKY